MEKLKSCSFCLVSKSFVRKFCFVFLFSAVAFLANGFFIFNIEKVFAESENITQINITTSSQSINVGTQSSVISLQTQNISGISEKVSETTHLILSSTSPTGQFYNANATSCTSLLAEPFTLTMSSGSANKNFCYQDSTSGTHTLNVSAEGKLWTPAIQDIIVVEDDDTDIFYTEVTEDISADTIWNKENSPYVINSPIYVLSDATLFMEEGVIVKFGSGGSLIVDGKLEAQGTLADMIYFTSLLDDSIGGDTNGDGDNTTPSEGDWDYLLIESEIESILNNVIEKYSDMGLVLYDGGSVDSNNFNSDKEILAFGSDSSFTNLVIPSVELFDGSTFTIEDSIFSNENNTLISVYNGSSLLLKNSTIQGESDYLVTISENSSADFDSVEVAGDFLSSTAFSVFGNSSLDINDSSILDNYNGFWIYDGSSFDIQNSQVECSNNGISVYHNSNLNLSGGNISCFNYGILLFNEIVANITGVKITDALDTGVIAYNNTNPNPVTITESEITGNNYGFFIFNSLISAHQNSIHDNFTEGATTITPVGLDFTSNYWGDPSGPTHVTNPDGIGDTVSDNILFTPFLLADPLVEVLEVRHPVILIPGITGTYLYKNYDDNEEIWPNLSKILLPGDDSYLNDLALNEDGTENVNFPIIPGDIIRGISGVHVFDNLIEVLIENGYEEGEDLFVFPYDWRFSTESTAQLLKEKIDNIVVDGEYEKVDIVAHSMGGLIAKKYIANNGIDKVDQLIFLGTPQLGSPKAFKTLMFGDNMGYQLFSILGLNNSTAKYISQNMPSVYELLPSSKYVIDNGSYVTDAMNEIIGLSSFELDYNQTKNLMVEKGRNTLMFPFAENLHQSIDSLDLSGVDTYNFVGCGIPTIGEVTLTQKRSWEKLFLDIKPDYRLGYTDGDETVPLVSANKTLEAEVYYASNVSHGSLPASESVINGIMSILDDKGIVFDNTLQDNDGYCGIEGDIVSTHSPVDLHIYDEEGNHTGVNENGDIENGIVGVFLDVIEDVNYVFLPKGENYKIVTRAIDTGGFNLKIEEQNGDDIVNSYNWTLIPLKTIDSSGEIWIGPDYSPEDYVIKMDDDGDGDTDNTYQENYDGTEEAEKIVYVNDEDSHNTKSGSIPVILNKMVIPMIEKNFDTFDTYNNDNLAIEYDSQTKIDNLGQENFEEKDESQDDFEQRDNKNNYTASAADSGVKVDLIWPVVIIFGLILILLAKMFIKL